MMATRERGGRRSGWLWRAGAGLLFLTLLAAGCGDDDPAGPGGGGTPESELTFLRQAATGPPLLISGDTTVIATRGRSLDVEIFYQAEDAEPGERGERFLRLRLEDGSLLRRPDGSFFGPDDTISIRIRIDPELLLVELGPSGLVFDPNEPARLELRYAEADGDLDDDGVEDDPDDLELEDDIDLWRQERPGEPWFRIGELKDLELDRVEARLLSFSRYALAI